MDWDTKTFSSYTVQVVIQWIETPKLVNSFVIFVFDADQDYCQLWYRLHGEENIKVCQW